MDTTSKIIRAATELFAARGYAVSTKEIAERAGVNEATLFRRFGDKHKLMNEVLRHFIDDVIPQERIGAALAIEDFEDSVRTYARAVMQVFSPEYCRVTAAFALEAPEALAEFVSTGIKKMQHGLAARIRRAQREKHVHAHINAHSMSRALHCTLYGHAASVAFAGHLWERVTHSRGNQTDNYVTMWLIGVLKDSHHLQPRK